MISISDSAIRKYVEFLKEQVAEGQIEPGKTIISVKVKDNYGPPGMKMGTTNNCRYAVMAGGYMTKVGTILDGKAIVNVSLGRDSVDEIVQMSRAAIDDENNGGRKPKGVKVDVTKMGHEEYEDEGVQVNLYELIDNLDYNETANLVVMLIEKLSYPVEDLSKRLVEAHRDVANHVDHIARLQEELKEVKVQLQTSREALGHARSNVAPRVVERYVTIEKKPIPQGMEHGATFGKDQKAIVVHRKPLMGHTPKVVRKHLSDK